MAMDPQSFVPSLPKASLPLLVKQEPEEHSAKELNNTESSQRLLMNSNVNSHLQNQSKSSVLHSKCDLVKSHSQAAERHQPSSRHTFNSEIVERITENLLVERLHDVSYDAITCKQLSQELAAQIMDRLKTLRIKHYKLVAIVSIGSINDRPGMQFGSRCLWHKTTDSFASVKFTNGSLFAVAMVYGLYFE